MSVRRVAGSAALLLCLCACESLGGGASRETLVAESTEFADESTRIADDLSRYGTMVAVTAAAARTESAFVDGVNQQLAQTMRAAMPPTQQIVNDSGPVTPGMIAPFPGQQTPLPSSDANGTPASAGGTNSPAQVGVALEVRPDDGCAVSLQSQISIEAPRIYATTRLENATAGATTGVTWSTGGQIVYTSGPYTIPNDDPGFCLWFYVEPTDFTFTPGQWSIQFMVNGAPAGPLGAFTFVP